MTLYLEALDGGMLVVWACRPEPARQGPGLSGGEVVAHREGLLQQVGWLVLRVLLLPTLARLQKHNTICSCYIQL